MAEDTHPLPVLPTPIVLADATLLEVDSPAHLLRLARDPKIGRHLLARIGDRMALVDRDAERALVAALRAGGHAVKLAKVAK